MICDKFQHIFWMGPSAATRILCIYQSPLPVPEPLAECSGAGGQFVVTCSILTHSLTGMLLHTSLFYTCRATDGAPAAAAPLLRQSPGSARVAAARRLAARVARLESVVLSTATVGVQVRIVQVREALVPHVEERGRTAWRENNVGGTYANSGSMVETVGCLFTLD